MIKAAKKRGYVTVDELNAVLPSTKCLQNRSKTRWPCFPTWAINVVEEDEIEEESAGEIVEAGEKALVTARKREPADRTDDPSVCICARWALSSCSPRGRDRHRQAHRGRSRDDMMRACARARSPSRPSSSGATS